MDKDTEDALRAENERLRARVDELERVLENLHAETTAGGSCDPSEELDE